ncbi:MAG: hypothetical protein ACJ765_11155 [Chloroflexota bacterium]
MRALEPLPGLRVVANPRSLDRARWSGGAAVTVLRLAPDEALAFGATTVDIDDDNAIVEREPGFSGVRLDSAALESVLAHVEFRLPVERPALVQGKVAGVPAKLLLDEDAALLVVQTAYVADLEARLR